MPISAPRSSVVVFLFALLVAFWPTTAAALSCGDALTASVTLDADLSCGSGGLVVFGDDIVIDLAGHQMQGSGGFGIDNALGFDRVVVKNGRIDGFDVGVFHGGGEGHLVKNVRCRGGINGFVLGEDVRFSRIEKSTVHGTLGAMITVEGEDNVVTKVVVGNGLGRGITLAGNRSVVTKSIVTGAAHGIFLTDVSEALISGNTLSANDSTGIRVGGGSLNTITKNRSEGNGTDGILLQFGENSVVSGNTVIGNQWGIRLIGADRNVVAKNLATGNFDDGIEVDVDSDDTSVTGNKAHRNRESGIAAESVTTRVAKNTADANAESGITAPNGAQDGGGNKARDNGIENCPDAFACK